MKVQCADCGEWHDLSDIQWGYTWPDAYLAVPEAEREERCRGGGDLMVIDGEAFFVRGVLDAPVHGEPRPFAWGVWARVSREHFAVYDERYDDPERWRVPPFPGSVANQLPGYPQTLGLPVEVRLGRGNDRPGFTLTAADHPLAREQREGIPVERVLEIVSPLLHRGDDRPLPLGEPAFATLHADGWELLDVLRRWRERDQVYWYPPDEVRAGLRAGWLAKLAFRIAAADHRGEPETHVERMWVEVDHRRGEGDAALCSGVLTNAPYVPGLVRRGVRAWFTPAHVLDVTASPGEPPASSTDPDVVHCRRHGPSFPAYVCRHLFEGEGLGFNRGDDPGNPRPDAWCDACERVRAEEGEWNDRSEAAAGITLVCGGCYDDVEAANRA